MDGRIMVFRLIRITYFYSLYYCSVNKKSELIKVNIIAYLLND